MGFPIKKAGGSLAVIFLLLLFRLTAPGAAGAEDAPYTLGGHLVRALPSNARAASPDGPAPLYIMLTASPVKDDVYLYGSAGQTTGKPTVLSVAVDGVSLAAPAFFPPAAAKADPWRAGAETKVYAGPLTMYVRLPESALQGRNISARLDGLACSPVTCTPLTLYLDLTPPAAGGIPLAALPGDLVPEDMPAFADTRGGSGGGTFLGPGISRITGMTGGTGGAALRAGAFTDRITPAPFVPQLEVSSLGKAVALGLLAGLILNLMPCVLPVIGIKMAAFFTSAGPEEERLRAFRRHQAFFALGILAWFTCLAALFHWLDLVWGQLFQSPVVVSILALVLLLLALSIFGVFNLPLIDLKAGNTKNPAARAFFEGFTATLLATPCGGPLLGGVLSWALLQPLGVLAATLGSIGLGMASPYLAFAAFPALAKRLPRPGPWMGALEFAIGFLLLAAAAYLVSFLPVGTPVKAAFALALALFYGWHWRRRMPAKMFGALCIALACFWLLQPGSADRGLWREYTYASFAEILGKRMILVDFTADWCPTCKMVEATALGEENLRKWETEYDLVFFRVDITRDNPEGAALLKAVGSASIPVIAVFGKGESALSPLVLRDLVTKNQIREALARAATRK